ncbi:MAG: hypothetical protein ACI81A_002543 [Paraglaciecola sp.]|jgi:hypothetical protein
MAVYLINCLIVPSNLPSETAFDLFDEFRRTLAEKIIVINDSNISVTVSIGVTAMVEGNLDTMISAADRLLYQAKHDGRNRVLVNYPATSLRSDHGVFSAILDKFAMGGSIKDIAEIDSTLEN